jgi:hypothetical protein
MYRAFAVKNFRGFREVKMEDLARVNLIAGRNNVGKTALLEALFLHCGAYNPTLTVHLSGFRGFESLKFEFGKWAETPWDTLFYGFDATACIELIGDDTDTGRRSYRLTVVRDPSQEPDLSSLPPQLTYSPGESVGILNASDLASVLKLVYEDNLRQGHSYLVATPGGARPVPIPPTPPFPAFFQGARMRIPFREEAERYGKLEIHGKQEVLMEVLQIIEPRLTRLAIVVVGDVPILHGDIKLGRLLPLPLLGEGMSRLASLIISIGNAEHGVVLVDEIENGLHYSTLTKVWMAIRKVARQFDTQVFATTHSLECISAAHEAFSHSDEYDFRLHRLDQRDSTIALTTYDQETLAAALEIGLEVR